MNVGKSAEQNVHDVPQPRAIARGDNADGARQKRNRTFARALEQSFGREPLLELLECDLKRSNPARLDFICDYLERTPRLEYIRTPMNHQRHPVPNLKAQALIIAAKH